jgi:hypothetical protein
VSDPEIVLRGSSGGGKGMAERAAAIAACKPWITRSGSLAWTIPRSTATPAAPHRTASWLRCASMPAIATTGSCSVRHQ